MYTHNGLKDRPSKTLTLLFLRIWVVFGGIKSQCQVESYGNNPSCACTTTARFLRQRAVNVVHNRFTGFCNQFTGSRNPTFDNPRIDMGKCFLQQLGEFESILPNEDEWDHQSRIVRMYDLLPSTLVKPIYQPYQNVWGLQRELVQAHLDRLSNTSFKSSSQSWVPPSDLTSQFISPSSDYLKDMNGVDTVVLCSHEPVYTLGTGADPNFIKYSFPSDDQHIEIVRIERGGEVTYHGPGQLVIYPILDLRGYKQDIHWYMRAIEECILIALASCGVKEAQRENNVTGVWIQGRKVAALGIKLKKWITMHGAAVNVEKKSLDNFNGIVPCGLVGREVCCINDFLDEPITVQDFAHHMIKAFEQVFCVKIMSSPFTTSKHC